MKQGVNLVYVILFVAVHGVKSWSVQRDIYTRYYLLW